MTAPQTSKITHRSVLAIAVPIMLSNVTEPLIGVVNAAVIGQLPEAYYIGAITVGALIFNFIFWGFGFLRLGTGGLTAQAAGAGDAQELVAVLLRALLVAGIAGVALILLSPLIGEFSFKLIEGSPEIEAHAATYFYIRVLLRALRACQLLPARLVRRPGARPHCLPDPDLPQSHQYGVFASSSSWDWA